LEISLNDRTLTILSTASLPVRRTIHNREIETHSPSNDSRVETLIPRSKQNYNNSEIIYRLYQQRLTNKSPNSKKRPLAVPLENSNVKKPKQQPEIIVLD